MGQVPQVESVPEPDDSITVAIDVARVERRKLVDEYYAFESFQDEICSLSTTQPGNAGVEWAACTATTGIDRVCQAYRNTVMSVPHYTEEYDDPLQRSLRKEFTADIATAVTTADRFYPHLKQTLVDATEEAIDRRQGLVQMIDEEIDSLERSRDGLETLCSDLSSLLDQPLETVEYNTLRATRQSLHDLLDACERLADARQTDLREHTTTAMADIEDFSAYLYGDHDIVHPVLSEVVTVLLVIERTIRYVESRLGRCD